MMGPSDKSARILGELQAFMAEHIYPNEVAHQEAQLLPHLQVLY